MTPKALKQKAVEMGLASSEYITDLERLADAVERAYHDSPRFFDERGIDEKLRAVGKLPLRELIRFAGGHSKTKPTLDQIERRAR